MKCPHCSKTLTRPARQGGLRFDLVTVVVDPDEGTVSGPCGRCRRMVTIMRGGELTSEFSAERAEDPAMENPRPRRVVRVRPGEGPAPHTG